ncbi:MAG: amino acid ABC transporter permease [Desulfovermiculus sp.]|nr:amino acid ABC transporter permease [Desulfovermiculus sp.]
MLAYWLEKRWVQYTSLAAVLAAIIVYVGFFFDFGYEFDWSILFTENPTYQEHLGLTLISGLVLTIKISLVSSGIALVLGIIFGLGRLTEFAPMRWLSTAYVEFFRNTPLLIQLFFWYFAFPMGLPQAAREYIFGLNYEFWCATVGLSMYTGSFMAEVIRAGLQSIPRGLLESAYSGGLSYLQVLRTIILPLAFRNIIPPLGSEFLNNMKNSSLAMVVGVAELTWSSQQVESLTFRGFEATTGATVLYLALSLIISAILNLINVKLKIETTPKQSWNRRLADLFFFPLILIHKSGSAILTSWYAKRAGRQKSLVRSPIQALAIQIKASTAKVLIFGLKVAFIACFLYAAYKLIQGLIGLNWTVIWENLGTLLIWRFPHGSENELFWGLGGLAYSILMAVIAISVSFFIGLVVGLGRASNNQLFRLPCLAYIELIRGNPLIIVIFWVYFFIPIVTGAFFDVFWSATIALTIFTGAYLAEIVRSGVQNIPPGQVEAAYSTGLSYLQTMRRIILPQALKQMIPAIVGQFIAIFKDTSLAFVIGVLELTFVAQGLNNRLMVYPFEIYTTVAFLYFICCYAMSQYARRLEARLSPEKQSLVM